MSIQKSVFSKWNVFTFCSKGVVCMKADFDFFIWCHFFITVGTKINSLEKAHLSRNKMFHCLWPSSPKISFLLGSFWFVFIRNKQWWKHVLLCFQSTLIFLFSPHFANYAAPFLRGLGTVLYSYPLCLLKHPTCLAVHSHHESSPSTSRTSYTSLQTTLQRQATARQHMDHSLKVLWCLSYQGAQFSPETNDMVRDESSSKFPLKKAPQHTLPYPNCSN